MGIQHHALNCKLFITTLVFILFSFISVSSSFAANSLFDVNDVTVDVTAQDSASAQEQAFNKAQAQAYQILARRMVEEEQVQAVAQPDATTISSLIQDYEVSNERLSAVRYVGTYNFRFRPEAVKQFFSVSGVKFTENQSRPLLVLPVFQQNGKNTIWSQQNLWLKAWSSAHLRSGVVPVEVPIGDLDDIADIDDKQALSYKRSKLDNMLGRYNAEEAAIMVAVPDSTLVGLSPSDKAMGRLRISVYRTDRARAEFVQDIELIADGNEGVSAFYSRAVDKSYAALQRDWKSKTAVSAAQSTKFQVRVPYSGLKQWIKAQNAIREVSGVNHVSVISVKKEEAFMAFTFRGDESRLRDYLSRKGLFMGDAYPNPLSQGFTQNGRNAPEMMYDVGYRKTTFKQHPINKTTDDFYNGVAPAAGSADAQNGASKQVHTF